MLDEDTKRRLWNRRQTKDETYDDTINRLLEESLIEISLEEAIESAHKKYEDICAISVDHGGLTESGYLYINIWSPNVIGGREVDVFSPSHRIGIEQDGEEIQMKPVVMEQGDYPDIADNHDRTTIFLEDMRSEESPVLLEDGIEHLKNKLQNPKIWEEEFESKTFATFQDMG